MCILCVINLSEVPGGAKYWLLLVDCSLYPWWHWTWRANTVCLFLFCFFNVPNRIMWWGCCWHKMEDKYLCQASLLQQLSRYLPTFFFCRVIFTILKSIHVTASILAPTSLLFVFRVCVVGLLLRQAGGQVHLSEIASATALYLYTLACTDFLFVSRVCVAGLPQKQDGGQVHLSDLASATALYLCTLACTDFLFVSRVCVAGLPRRQDGGQVHLSDLASATALYLCTLACTNFLFVSRVCVAGLPRRQDGGQVHLSDLASATALYLCTLACTDFLFVSRVCVAGLPRRQDGGQVQVCVRPCFCNSSLPP